MEKAEFPQTTVRTPLSADDMIFANLTLGDPDDGGTPFGDGETMWCTECVAPVTAGELVYWTSDDHGLCVIHANRYVADKRSAKSHG